MNYEQKYKESMLIAEHHVMNGAMSQDEAEALFPELRESEDERIRKELWEYFHNLQLSSDCDFSPSFTIDDILAYLEKQKEQKLVVMKPHKGDDGNPYDMGVSEAQDYAINRGFGIPFNDGEVYVDERHLTQTIGNILRWADEHPKEQKPASTVKSKFKSGDRIRFNGFGSNEYTIQLVGNGYYVNSEGGRMDMSYTDANFVLIENAQKEQQPTKIQWTGSNLKEVIDFMGKSPKFNEWFKSWEDFENYVHSHDDILKLFCEDGSHYEVPAGAWIVKTTDGYNISLPVSGSSRSPQWGEEDEKMVQFWNMYYEQKVGDWPNKDVVEHLERFKEWLNNRFKSLRPQTKGKWAKRLEEAQARWKPSEEQMAALAAAKMGVDTDYELLESLYEQLKSL